MRSPLVSLALLLRARGEPAYCPETCAAVCLVAVAPEACPVNADLANCATAGLAVRDRRRVCVHPTADGSAA